MSITEPLLLTVNKYYFTYYISTYCLTIAQINDYKAILLHEFILYMDILIPFFLNIDD